MMIRFTPEVDHLVCGWRGRSGNVTGDSADWCVPFITRAGALATLDHEQHDSLLSFCRADACSRSKRAPLRLTLREHDSFEPPSALAL